ncbi:MAG: pentapeptide repeat-containing protein [Deltaproteobacteria bacterium]|jgi:uncharacterized protein YjbI with pentapeptide repeats|nr:pentapeptide repeat-containing protein [Deltaproteobacteria bacterium]
MALGPEIVTLNMSAAAMAANPTALSGKRITCDIEGDFVLENAVIKKATFANSKIWRSTIRNVTFENCAFTQTHFMSVSFENVIFKGGSVSYRPNPRYQADDTSFEDVRFINVVMDGVALNEAYFQVSSRGGNLTLKNLTSIKNKYVSFYIGNSQVVFDNCQASGELLAVLSGKQTTAMVKNCEFRKYSGIGGNCKAVFIKDSKFLNFSYVGGGVNTVIENSVLTGQIGNANIYELYLINNQHLPSDPKELTIGRSVLQTHIDGKVYLDGKNLKKACLTIVSGSTFIRDLDCLNLILGQSDKTLIPQSLDLLNVTISGLIFIDLDLKSSRWQKVTLEPPIELENSKIGNLETFEVSLPREFMAAATSGGNHIKISKSQSPFNFPPIVPPSPESLGVRVE